MILHYASLPNQRTFPDSNELRPNPSTPQLRGGMTAPDSLLAPPFPSLLQNKLYTTSEGGRGDEFTPHEGHHILEPRLPVSAAQHSEAQAGRHFQFRAIEGLR